MTIQDFLKTLKTAKRALTSNPCSSLSNETKDTLLKTLINSASNTLPSTTPTESISSFLSAFTSHKFQSFLSDPNVKTSDCLLIFNFVLHYQYKLSLKPDLHAHLTLICRLIKSRKFLNAEILLNNLILDQIYRYPFSDFALWIENYCNESKIVGKLLNMLLKVYSDTQMFDMASKTFDYMKEKGFQIDERTCSVHLLAMTRFGKVDSAFEFFHRMIDSSMEVSVYSLTIVVSALCKSGALSMARELVAEMAGRGIKPNIITFNVLVDGCVRRWNLVELDLVLRLIKHEGIQFSDTTYKLLIEGYSGFGKVEEAERLLLEMREKGFEVEIYLYDVVIRGYCRLGNMSSGHSLYKRLQGRMLPPSVDIDWTLIAGLCKVGEMGLVKEMVTEMKNKGGELDDYMCNTLVKGYRKAGMVVELGELQHMIDMKWSPVHASSQDRMDFESQVELVMDDEVKPVTLDNSK